MAIAYVHEFEAGADRSTANYDAIGERMRLAEDPPEGLILHAAGFKGDRFQMLEVWESAELREAFERERLDPAIREVAGQDGSPPVTESFELHNLVARA